jgi:hypothetical protein
LKDPGAKVTARELHRDEAQGPCASGVVVGATVVAGACVVEVVVTTGADEEVVDAVVAAVDAAVVAAVVAAVDAAVDAAVVAAVVAAVDATVVAVDAAVDATVVAAVDAAVVAAVVPAVVPAVVAAVVPAVVPAAVVVSAAVVVAAGVSVGCIVHPLPMQRLNVCVKVAPVFPESTEKFPVTLGAPEVDLSASSITATSVYGPSLSALDPAHVTPPPNAIGTTRRRLAPNPWVECRRWQTWSKSLQQT